jgi:cellobiose transport system substrate-binding protein
MRKAGRTTVAIAGILAASLALTAACSSSSGNSSGQITLKVRLFGTFGYKEAGLFDQYEKAHPNIKIDYSTVEQEATYWTGLQTSLASGAGLGDVQGIEVGRIAAVTSQLGDKFVDLNQYGAGDVKGDFYPWKFAAGTTADGKVIGLGTDIGPLALCYRADLFKAAGLPSDPSSVSALWASNGWDGFVAAGQQYMSHAPAGSHWVDTAGGFFNAIIGQSANQYYDKSGNVVATTNPAVKAAWDESVKMTGNLSAALSQFSTAWNVAFTTGTFATIACPSWMVGYIKSEAGAMSGQWNIASIPGGGGNWGGSYLGVPAKADHPKEAADLVKWLTAADQEAAIFKAVGNFPSNSKAASSADVANATDAYFSGGTGDAKTPAPIGKIFGESASNLVVAITGPHDGDIKNAISTALTRVETGQQSAADSWNQLVSKDIPAVVS